MRHSSKTLLASIMVVAGLLMAGSARADIIPTLTSTTPSGPDFLWSYNASLSASENLVPGNFFTIYDVVGLVSSSETDPTNWSFGEHLLGTTAPSTLPPDSGSILNITFTYNGPATGPTTVDGPQSSLGTFTFLSTDSVPELGWFTAVAVNNSGPNAGSPVSNVGNVTVPGTSVPLPAALPVGLALLAGLGLKRKLA